MTLLVIPLIFIIAPLSTVFLFTSTFAQFIKTHPLPTPKRHGVTAFFEDIRRHCASVAFPVVAEPKICENIRHEHVLSVHAWTRLKLSTSGEPLHDRWLMRPAMVIWLRSAHQIDCTRLIGLKGRLHSSARHRRKTQSIAFSKTRQYWYIGYILNIVLLVRHYNDIIVPYIFYDVNIIRLIRDCDTVIYSRT